MHVQTECDVVTINCALLGVLACAGPTSKSCDDEVTSMTTPTVTTTKPSTTTSSIKPSPTPSPTSEPPSKVVGVRVTPGVQNTSPTLTVEWQALVGGAVTYTVKYSTQPGELNTPPEGALEVRGISGTSTILTALERGTTYYIWVVGVSEGGEGPHSDRRSGVTYDCELDYTSDSSLPNAMERMCMCVLTISHYITVYLYYYVT